MRAWAAHDCRRACGAPGRPRAASRAPGAPARERLHWARRPTLWRPHLPRPRPAAATTAPGMRTCASGRFPERPWGSGFRCRACIRSGPAASGGDHGEKEMQEGGHFLKGLTEQPHAAPAERLADSASFSAACYRPALATLASPWILYSLCLSRCATQAPNGPQAAPPGPLLQGARQEPLHP